MIRKILDESWIEHNVSYFESDGGVMIQFVPNGCQNTLMLNFNDIGALQTIDVDFEAETE
jgi:hypothetical protein